jgi:hypothetical protein
MFSLNRNIGFGEVWDELKECFKTICIRCLAFQKGSKWFNIMITGFLSRKGEDDLRNEIIMKYGQLKNLRVTEISKLLLTFDIYEATYFPKFVENLSSGSLTIRGECIMLGEKIETRLESYPHLYLQEPYEFPRINLIALGPARDLSSERNIREIEEELKTCGYLSLDELGEEWLMLPQVKSYGFNTIIDIPIYFLPISVSLDGNTLYFRAICHKALAEKLSLRVTLRRLLQRNYIPVENYRLTFPTPTEELGEVVVKQPFKSSLSREDEVQIVATSKIGRMIDELRKVEDLLRKEVLGGEFPKLISQFVPLDRLEELIKDKQVGGEIKRADLSFQRIVIWLLSMLGFQLVELEGTAYKMVKEENGTPREIDVLMYDPQNPKKMYVIDVTLRSPKDEKIDDLANLQLLLQRRGIFVEPMIIVGEYAAEKKKNVRNVKVLDLEDLQSILNALRRGKIEEAKKVVS